MGLAQEEEHFDNEASDDAVVDSDFEDPLISSMCCREGYGELTRGAVEKMAAAVGLSKEEPAGHFFDLGSGAGKIVMHLLLAGYASEATGVEISANRHAAAVHLATEYLNLTSQGFGEADAFADVELAVAVGKTTDHRAAAAPSATAGQPLRNNNNNNNNKQLNLLEGDMLDADLSGATAVYMNHACFPKDIVDALVDKLLLPGSAPKLDLVLTTPRLPALVASGQFVAEPGYLNLPMVGTLHCCCSYYYYHHYYYHHDHRRYYCSLRRSVSLVFMSPGRPCF